MDARRRWIGGRAVAAPLALGIAGLAACGSEEPAPAGGAPAAARAVDPADPREVLARERAAKHFALDEKGLALEALRPLLARAAPREDDLVSAAILELGLGDEQGLERLRGVLAANPRSARAHYVLGVWRMQTGDFAAAEEHLRRVRELAPDDVPSRILLAEALELSRPDEAERLYREVQALGVDRVGSWYALAIFRLSGVLMAKSGSEAELAAYERERFALLAEKEELDARGIQAPQDEAKYRGELGKLPPPPSTPGGGAAPGAPPEFGAAAFALPELANAALQALDADDDCRTDLLGVTPGGALVLALARGGEWRASTLVASGVAAAHAFDLGNDDDLDVAYLADGALRLVEAVRDPATREVSWKPREAAAAAVEGSLAGASIVAVDFDHEGDLDLVLVGASGVRLLRSDGAEQPDGRFTDVTAEAGLPRGRAFAWCVPEDYDTDQDVDLLFGGATTFLASNLRGGRFEDRSASLAGFASAARAVVADFDHDSRPDLWSPESAAALWLGQPSGRFARTALQGGAAPPSWSRAELADLDLDGFFDVVGVAADGLGLVRALGWERGNVASTLALADACAAASFAIDDFDGDLKPDLAVACERGVAFVRGESGFGATARLKLRGRKDNRRGVGAVVELRAGGRYQRIYWRGGARLVGAGDAAELDWHRTLWPDGSFQWTRSVALGDRACLPDALKELEQSDALRGSCPFLYTWNGTRNVFVTDVLGITPLGLPIAPGVLVPPDHDEYVLVRGSELAPRHGFFELHLTEELREVTYLDRVRLDVIDHPAGTEVFPNERFSFPPFPAPHVHTLREPLAPARAVDGDGRDWTAALAANDELFAAPFTPEPAQFRGLARPHFLELEFDRERVASAARLRLFLSGWFLWTDASVNVASAFDPLREFVPPIVQVPDGSGGWRDAGPPIGFPAGKTKTMVVDAEAWIDRSDPRLRLVSTLQLRWDSIRLATDADDAPCTVVELEPASAELWRRGFSAPRADARPDQPERFDWERLAEHPSWNPHPGLYTRYGECLPLLGAVDDRFVILASGDALSVRFDARELAPPAPGRVRDFFLFLDGWAKDRDPNTVEAQYVEPLPFHGMSGYPYGPDERFPDGAEHRAWRREWNTRWAEPWIRSLAEGEPQLPARGPSKASIAPRN